MKKYSTLLSLYLAQSIPMSFFSTIVPVIMRQENYSLESIGYLQLLKLPWILKLLWAPMIDKHGQTLGKYKRWIVGSELFYAAIILGTGFLDLKTDFMAIVVMMLVAFTASATQDIATDAFAILVLKKNERSFGNSMQSAGTFLGTLTGSGVMLVIYHHFGWNGLLLCLSLFVVVALVPLYFFDTKKTEMPPADISRHTPASFKDIGLFFVQKGMWKRLILLFFYYSGLIGTLAMLKPFFVDHGYNIRQIGTISGIYGTAVGALSALAAGHLINKLGRRFCMYLFSFMGFVTMMLFVWMGLTDVTNTLLYAGTFMLWGTYGLCSVLIYTISMDVVRKGREGTDFTIQIVVTHLSSLVIAVLSGKFADTFGYQGLFIAEAAIAAMVFMFIPLLYNEIRPKDESSQELAR
ncbi:MAG: MFS transporter [Breznakibacter sp.]